MAGVVCDLPVLGHLAEKKMNRSDAAHFTPHEAKHVKMICQFVHFALSK